MSDSRKQGGMAGTIVPFGGPLRDGLAAALGKDDKDSPLALALRNQPLPKHVQALVGQTTQAIVAHNHLLGREEAYAAGMKDRILLARVTKQLAVDERLTMFEGDVREALDKSMRSSQALNSLEQRILSMRNLLRKQDATANVDLYGRSSGSGGGTGQAGAEPTKGTRLQVKTSSDLISEELTSVGKRGDGMEDCPKCSRAFLIGFLRRHLEDCDGTKADDEFSEEEEEEDEEGGSGSSNPEKAAVAERAATLARKRGDMMDCPVCVRKFAEDRIEAHVAACRMKDARRLARAATSMHAEVPSDPAAAAAMWANAIAPKAPQKVRALAVGPTSIPLLWDQPLYDGGAPILEYEIEFSIVENRRISRRETEREEVVQPIVGTTRWVANNPVAHRGFSLTGLPANTEVVHLKVRAVNEKGRGEWSDELASVRTLPAVAPTPPLLVALDTEEPPTSSAFTITWEAPLDEGGDRLTSYEVRYNVLVPDFEATTRVRALGGSKQGGGGTVQTASIPKTLRVPAPCNRARVSGLFGPCTFTDVTVVAITVNGLLSPPALPIPSIRTLPMGRYDHVQYELGEKRAMTTVDVSIVDAGGLMQVVGRLGYIKRLEEELAAIEQVKAEGGTEEDFTRAEEAKRTAPPVNANAGNNGVTDVALREGAVRRKHFEQRIATLQAVMDALSDGIMRQLERRTQLKQVLVQADRRWRVLVAENEQVKNYRGKFIDSSVMHGRTQRFPAATLKAMIGEELEEVAIALHHGKVEMIAVAEEMDKLKAERARTEEAFKERRAAFLAFENDEARKARAAKFAVRLTQASVYRCFTAWKSTLETKRNAQAKMAAFMSRWSNMALTRGWRRWWSFVTSERSKERMDALQGRDDMMPGLGSSMLLAVERQRQDAGDDVTSLLQWLRRVEAQLDAADASLVYRRRIKDADIAVIQPRGGPAVRAAAAASAASAAASRADGTLIGPLVPMTLPVSASMTVDGDILSTPMPTLKMLDGPNESKENVSLGGEAMGSRAEAQMARDISGEGAWEAMLAQAEQKHALERKGPDAILEGKLREDVEAHARALLARGEAYMRAGEHERSLLALKRAEMVYGWRKDSVGLLTVYRLLATLLERVGRYDLGVLHWDRCLQMAKEHEVGDVLAAAESHEGRGRCLSARQSHEEALRAFERAEDIHDSRDDQPAVARLLRLESVELDLVGRSVKAREMRGRADEIEHRVATLITSGIARLMELENDLIGVGLAGSRQTHLEAVGPAVPLLRQQMHFLEVELHKLRAVGGSTKHVMDREERKHKMLVEEAERAEGSDARTMECTVLAGHPQVYEINELRMSLRKEATTVGELLDEARREHRGMVQRIENMDDELAGLQEYLDAETRELSKLAHARKPLRCVAINGANVRTNNVVGTATGGVPRVAGAIESQVYTYSTMDGACNNSFVGDSDRNPLGQPVGHTRVITCIAYYGSVIYTGSQDCTIRAWDAETERGWGKNTPVEAMFAAEEREALAHARAEQEAEAEKAEDEHREYVPRPLVMKGADPQAVRRVKAGQSLVMVGHTGTVTCIAADSRLVISGSADKTTIVWNAANGELLRRLRGHEYAVSAVSLSDLSFATGGADWDVRLWHVTKASKAKPAKVVEMVRRMKGHLAPVTCISLQGLDCVSGAANGEVVVWDTEAGAPLRKHQVHTLGRPVFCLQFDAIKVVSAGADARLVFTDIITGDAIQTAIRSHGDAHIIALSFDTERLVTMGADRTMRTWAFKGSEPVPIIKLHVLRPGEKLPTLAKKFGVRVKDIMRWNGVTDVRNFYDGMRIIVAPPPGSDAYEAMVEEENRARREKEQAAKAKATRDARDGKAGAFSEGSGDGGSGRPEEDLLASILAKAKESEVALDAIQAAKSTAAVRAASSLKSSGSGGEVKRGKRAPPPADLLSLSMPSSMAVPSQGARKVAASTNVWGRGAPAAPTPVPPGTEGDPQSTTVGAAVAMPSEAVLVSKALRQPNPNALATINPSSSPFARQDTVSSGVGGPGLAPIANTRAQSSLRNMLAPGPGVGLVGMQQRSVRSMAAAAQTRLPMDSAAARSFASSALSAQISGAGGGGDA